MKSELMILCCAIVVFFVGFHYDVSIEAAMVACTACVIRAIKEIEK